MNPGGLLPDLKINNLEGKHEAIIDFIYNIFLNKRYGTFWCINDALIRTMNFVIGQYDEVIIF